MKSSLAISSSLALLAVAAAPTAAADRLAYNAATGRAVQGGGELIDALDRGEVAIDALPAEQLPEELRGLGAPERAARVDAKRKQRQQLQARLETLLADRSAHVAAERKRQATAGKGDAFDEEVAKTVREQAMRKGLRYGE